ncbi:pyridoxal phosphate-dependent transferase [Syncephalis fuscata]|nr:pyridoxal phosphate-dependent transferase [Syncephalis fuscata]
MLHKHISKHGKKPKVSLNTHTHLQPMAYAARYFDQNIPKYELSQNGLAPTVAYRAIHDELELDGRPVANFATFLSTWMEPECEKLIMDSISKNFADMDEYPATQDIHERCVSILADLWKGPTDNDQKAIGTAVAGSSEGVMLAGLALKWIWRKKQQAKNKDTSKPNIIFGYNAQVVMEKFARYFDVEPRRVPVSEESNYCLDAEKAVSMVDENTIGIFAILGSTYTGHYEPIEKLCKLLDELEERTGLDVHVHVDAASGGFVAPFATPDLRWSFELPRVVSINASGHKFGLVYPGIGWVVWRNQDVLPKDLVFELHYLGGTEHTFTLNFSRPSCFVMAQYYNFLRLGRVGYTNVMNTCLSNARLLSAGLMKTGFFDVISCIHKPADNSSGYVAALPLVAFKISDKLKKEFKQLTEYRFSALMRYHGWIIPAYALAPNCENTKILRIVIHESTTVDLVTRVMKDAVNAIKSLMESNLEGTCSVAMVKETDISSEEADPFEHKKQHGYARPC